VKSVAGWLFREHWLIGASITRIMLGAWAVYYYLLHYPVRSLLWGPAGIWPYDRFIEHQQLFSVWQLGPSPVLFEALYHLGIVIAVAYTLGLWPRVMGVLHWVMIWSLGERNPFIGDGGDNIMRIVLLFLILVNTGAYFSLKSPRPADATLSPTTSHQVAAVIHNFGVLLILAQLSMLYMSTGLYKAMGELWQNGTALYYILRVEEFSWPGVADFVFRSPYFVVLGTYGTVLFEILFFPLLFNRWTRYALIVVGGVFHLGITLFMGLVTFGWSMFSIYPLLLTDREYEGLTAWFRRRLGLVVFYDGWCPLCTRSIRWLGRFDLLSLVRFVSFRDPGVVERYGLDERGAERRIQSVGWSGRLHEGITAMLDIAVRSIPLWPAVPVFIICRMIAGQRVYDAIASRRLILVPGGCVGHCPLGETSDAGGR
jgi:predicted DCC family thiol-disulfide oxidoreductase YuxK